MKKIFIRLIVTLFIISFTACSISLDDSMLYDTDNENTNWTLHSSNGYSGGDVQFASTVIIGEWNIVRTVNNSGLTPSFNPYFGVIFDSLGWYEYEYDLIYNSQWIYKSAYGVSRDGLSLQLDDYHTYSFDSLTGVDNEYEYCINAVESITMDVYEFCKLNY